MFSIRRHKQPIIYPLIAAAVFAVALGWPPSPSADEGHGHEAQEEQRGEETHDGDMHGDEDGHMDDGNAEDGHMDDGHADDGHGHAIMGGEPGDPSEVDRTIRIEASDIAFDRQHVEVEAGETIRFVITNAGQLVHDFTLGTREMQSEHRQEMLRMMQQGTMPGEMQHDDPNAVTIPPGETREIIWRFAKAQNFEFACNVPGHYEAGMKGDIEIEDDSS